MKNLRSRRASRMFSTVVVAIPLLVALGVVIALLFFPDNFRPTGANAVRIAPGGPVPEVRLAGADGAVTPLPRLLGDGTAIITLMTPDCVHCHSELKTLGEMLAAPGARPQVVVVSVGDSSRTPALRTAYPGIAIYDDVDGAFGARYGLRSVPVLLFTDRAKKVRAVRGGYLSERLIRGILSDLPGS